MSSTSHKVMIDFFGNTKQLDDALVKAGAMADKTAGTIGSKFEEGGKKAGGAMSKLGTKLESWGVPFGSSITKAGDKFSEVEGKGKKFGAAMSAVGKTTVMAVGGAALAVGAEAIKMGMAYQTATAALATHAGISVKSAQQIGAAFLSTGGSTEFSAQEMMNAFAPVSGEFVNLTGHALDSKQSLTVMNNAMDLATASGSTLADSTKAIADVMLPFHMSVGQSSQAADTLWNTQKLLGVSTTDLSSTFQRIIPRVAGSGMSFGQMSGLVVELSHSLGGGRQAMRLAGTAIQGIISPTSTANKALASMGVNLFNTQGKFIGMPAALDKLKTGLSSLPGATNAVSAQQKILALTTESAQLKAETQTKSVKAQDKAISGQLPILKTQVSAFSQSSAMQSIFGRNANAMLAVISGGSKTLNHYTGMVTKSGSAAQAAKTNSGTWKVEIATLKSSVEDLGTSLGTALIPIVNQVITVTMSVVKWFEKHKAIAEILAGAIGTFLVAAIGVWIGSMVAATATSVASFATMVAKGAWWVAQNVAQMVVWVATNAASIAESIALWVMYAAEWIATTVSSTVTFIATHAAMAATFVAENTVMIASAVAAFIAENAATLGIMAGIALLVGAIIYLATHWKQVWSDVQKLASEAWHFLDSNVFQPVMHWFNGIITPVINTFKSTWDTVWNGIKSTLKTVWHFMQDNIFTPLHDFIKTRISNTINNFKSLWDTVWNGIKSTIKTVWDFISPIFDKITSAIKTITGGISSISKIGGGITKGIGGAISSVIPHLASGGVVNTPTLALIGEAGREYVIPETYFKGRPGGVGALPGAMPTGTAGGSGTTINYAPNIVITGLPQQITQQVQAHLEAHTQDLVNLMETRVA